MKLVTDDHLEKIGTHLSITLSTNLQNFPMLSSIFYSLSIFVLRTSVAGITAKHLQAYKYCLVRSKMWLYNWKKGKELLPKMMSLSLNCRVIPVFSDI